MKRDLTAGSAVIFFGALYATYAVMTLPLGTVRRMGPGMFPFGLGALLVLVGIGIVIPALRQDMALPRIPVRSLACVLGSIAAFALLIQPTGLVPTVLATTVLVWFAQPGSSPKLILPLWLGLSVLTWLLFVVVLKLPIPLATWPF